MNAARALIEATLSKFVLPLRDLQCWILFSISLGNPYQVSIIRSMYATFSRNSCLDPIEHAACIFCHVGVAAFNDGPAHNPEVLATSILEVALLTSKMEVNL